MSYEETLIAYGIPADEATRMAWANDMQMWRNRESALYGVQDEAELERTVSAARGIA